MDNADVTMQTQAAREKSMSWEAAVNMIKGDPSFRKLVMDSFFDDPITSAAERFYNCSEWRATRDLIAAGFRPDYLPDKMKAIDIGAGRGMASYALSRDGWNVTALEPYKSETLGSLAIKKLIKELDIKKIDIAEEYGESLNFSDGSFDLVYMRQALHHAKDLAGFCREAARVLKPGGVFIAAREHILTKKSDLETFLNNHPLHKYYGGENAYTFSEYAHAIEKSGINLTRVLKTYDSDINLYPDTMETLRARLARKTGFRPPEFVFNLAVAFLNFINNSAGRLYTFAGVRK